MPTKPPTVDEKIGDWLKAYNAIRYEVTDEALRMMVDLTRGNPDEVGMTQINIGIQMARIVYANDRAAAIAAAMLTQSGVSRPVVGDIIEEV